jgi:hypothetical protein
LKKNATFARQLVDLKRPKDTVHPVEVQKNTGTWSSGDFPERPGENAEAVGTPAGKQLPP